MQQVLTPDVREPLVREPAQTRSRTASVVPPISAGA
jgi:hypothetical protein